MIVSPGQENVNARIWAPGALAGPAAPEDAGAPQLCTHSGVWLGLSVHPAEAAPIPSLTPRSDRFSPMWNGKRVSVILPTYNEKDSIAACIEGFLRQPFVDEVIVVDNNAAAGTREEVGRTGARLIEEKRQGYGWAIQAGLRATRGDLIAVCEPDGTFVPEDLEKLLVYTRDFDIVFGSRTLGWMIWEQANMGWFLRLGNIVVAKLIQVLFNCRSFSDVGCTYRVLSREASDFLLPHYRVGGSHFGPEMMLRSLIGGCRTVQIPVNYRARVGVSSVTGSRPKAIGLGVRMIALIFEYRIGSWLGRPRYTLPHLRASRRPDDSRTAPGAPPEDPKTGA